MFTISRFGELLKLLPRGVFDAVVRREQADKYRKSFSSWQQMLVMIYGQFSGATSLRVLEKAFNAQPGHHYHLGCKFVRRSTLSQTNASGCVEAFEATAQALMQRLPRALRREGKQFLHLLDSSGLTLKGRGFDVWTRENRTNYTQGLKLHVLYGLTEEAPLAQAITAPNINDIEYARRLGLQPGITYVFDKGYCDYSWWWEIEQKKARFVTRFKRNARLQVVARRVVPKASCEVILKDEQVVFSNKNPGAGRRNPYRKALRRIEVAREGKPPLVLATNDLRSSAQRIADHYRARWQIELFFKWIKQHLRIKRFLGRSETAVRIQILSALIAYLLVALHANAQKLHNTTLWMHLAELQATLFQRPDFERQRHREWRERRREFQLAQPDLFA
jgi:putative transposase